MADILVPFSGTIIDTSAIDAWRQGVEITLWKHYDAGTVKIFSGEKGHKSAELSFGQDTLDDPKGNRFYPSPPFLDAQTFTSLDEIFVSYIDHDLIQNIEGNGSLLNGNIELFFKRRKAITALDHFGIPLKPGNSIQGALMSGNELVDGSDVITSIYEIESNKHNRPYDELQNATLDQRNLTNDIMPFDDLKTQDVNNTSDVQAALNNMTPETEEYVSNKQNTGLCGFVYNGIIMTDSIVFGGNVFR